MKPAYLTITRAIAVGLVFGSALVAAADPVVFNVNLSVQTALGNFHPGTDTVLVAGNWDGWVTTHTLAVTANPDVYSITQNLAAASYPNYKFVINPNGNSTGNALNWEVPSSFGGANRWFQVPASGGTNLPVVYFSDAANAPAQFQVTFQVNMAVAIAQGHFVIGADYVDAFGSWNNWLSTGGLLLTNVPGTSNYLGTLITTNTLNSVLFYKYAIDGNGGTWEGNVGTNGTQNRSLTLASYLQVLPLDYWNNIFPATANTNAVTFSVDMLVEYALGNFDPIGNGDTLWVNGDWDWSGSAMQLVQTADPYVYTGTVALVYSPGTVVNYKYAMNGGVLANSWEMNGVGPGGGNNRQFVFPAGSATNLPLDHFNNFTDLGPVTITPLSPGKTNVLAWASGTNANNHIRLQSSPGLSGGWVDVPNTQGQSSVTNSGGPGATFYRLIAP
jgi:hypothetical protein